MTSAAAQRTIRALPDLAHTVVDRIGGLRARLDGPAGSPWEAPLPINVDAYEDAADLWAGLLGAVADIAHLTHRPMPALAQRAWRGRHAGPAKLPAWTLPATVRDQVAELTDWLAPAALNTDDAYLDELLTIARRVAARYPTSDRPTRVKDAVCPRDRGALTVHPPRHVGDAELLTCGTCGAVRSGDDLPKLAAWFTAVTTYEAAAAKSRRTAARLAAKYGQPTA